MVNLTGVNCQPIKGQTQKSNPTAENKVSFKGIEDDLAVLNNDSYTQKQLQDIKTLKNGYEENKSSKLGSVFRILLAVSVAALAFGTYKGLLKTAKGQILDITEKVKSNDKAVNLYKNVSDKLGKVKKPIADLNDKFGTSIKTRYTNLKGKLETTPENPSKFKDFVRVTLEKAEKFQSSLSNKFSQIKESNLKNTIASGVENGMGAAVAATSAIEVLDETNENKN